MRDESKIRQDRNWAEHDKRIVNAPTLGECYRTGQIHKSYGWTKSPFGNWSYEQKAAYDRGYDSDSYRELCFTCNGEGRIHDLDAHPGMFHAADMTRVCPICDGTGKVEKE